MAVKPGKKHSAAHLGEGQAPASKDLHPQDEWLQPQVLTVQPLFKPRAFIPQNKLDSQGLPLQRVRSFRKFTEESTYTGSITRCDNQGRH